MKHAKVVITAFCICTGLSLIIGTLLLFNAKAMPEYTRMMDTGKQVLEAVLEMESQEQAYLLAHREDVLEDFKEKTGKLRKLLTYYEKDRFTGAEEGEVFQQFDVWEEALNLYDRLFDQFVLYHEAVEKSIAEIRALEKSILAVIFSKMNPERGIIALQEIRIHEKGYLLYRNHPKPPEERPFEDMRKEAVNNLLVWAQEDKRIKELMEKDDQLFGEILNNYEGEDHTIVALRKESGRIRDVGQKLFEEGNKRLHVVHRRSVFLSITLLIMWFIVALAIIGTRFR
jgi:hypothetical protein